MSGSRICALECTSPGTGQWEGPAGLRSQDRSKDHQVCAISHVFPYFPGELKSSLSYIVLNCFLGPTGQCTWGNDTFYDLTLIEYNQFSISKVTKFLKILGSSFFFFPVPHASATQRLRTWTIESEEFKSLLHHLPASWRL